MTGAVRDRDAAVLQPGFARIAALLADPAREAMLVALLGGRALPAGDLAEIGGVSAQSASGHLKKLVDGGVLSVWSQGRFRYFRIAGAEIAGALEALSVAASATSPSLRRAPSRRLALARSCYNHLAGRLGVALADRLQKLGLVKADGDVMTLTAAGDEWARRNGLDPSGAGRQPLVRPCLDWSERRFHLAGRLPSQILDQLIAADRLRRRNDRSLEVTKAGAQWFAALGIDLDDVFEARGRDR